MAERTLFCGLPLEGRGTWEVESLRSYIERLAYAHSFKPRRLLEALFSRFPLGDESINMQHLLRFWDVHGHADAGPVLVRRLEAATLTPLTASTMRRFERLFSLVHLVRQKNPVYCPECCSDHEMPTYGRLLWEVQGVTACPKHRVLLRSVKRCDAPAAERLSVNRRPAMRAVCGGCGSIGFACVAEPAEPATDSAVWVAQQAGALLALDDSQLDGLTRESCLVGLRDVVQQAFGGSVVNASLDSGLARATVHTWLHGDGRPSLAKLLQFCLRARADLLELLRGRYQSTAKSDVEGPGPLTHLAPRPYVRPAMSRQDMEQRLKAALAAEEVVSVRRLCNEIGISPRSARELFPDLVRVLAKRSMVKGATDDERRFQEASEAYERAAEQLRAEGKFIGVKYLQQRAGLVAHSRNPARVRALRQVLEKMGDARAREGDDQRP